MLINEERLKPSLKRVDEAKQEESNLWYLCNGARNHMTSHISKFDKLDESVVGQVKFGDGSVVEIKRERFYHFEMQERKNQDAK